MKLNNKPKLDFKSNSITELNDSQQQNIQGGGDTKVTFYFVTIPNPDTVSLIFY